MQRTQGAQVHFAEKSRKPHRQEAGRIDGPPPLVPQNRGGLPAQDAVQGVLAVQPSRQSRALFERLVQAGNQKRHLSFSKSRQHH